MKKITIAEFPSNLGLKEPSPGHEPGVKKLPAWLRAHDLHKLLQPENVFAIQPPAYTMNVDIKSGVRNAEAIIQYAKEQAVLIGKLIEAKKFVLAIGGDCSILIGNMLALKQAGNYGLFFLDGHTDFITPELSGTAGAAGMDLAIVAGHGHEKLTNINNQKPYVQEEHIYCVGNREYDETYEKPVKDAAVEYIDLISLRERRIEKVASGFLQMIQANKLDGFWLHVDLDVLDDDIMPAVDSRTTGGLSYDEFMLLLKLLLSDNNAVGMEITILDPELDPGGKYTRDFVYHFCKLFNEL